MVITRFVAALAVIALGAAACAEEVQLDFEQQNADSFMAACTSATDDPLIQTQVCQCVIDTAEARLRFSEFETIEGGLEVEVEEGASAPPMPPELVEIVAECVIEEGKL